MTENQLRNKVVSIMKGWVGLKESDGSHKKILAVYNSFYPLPRGVKMVPTYAWCAATVSAAFIEAGLSDIAPVECSCTRMIQLYKNLGRWQELDSYVPKPGDLIMYDWNDTGKGDCTGTPEHVGMVVAVNGTEITVLEGNKNDAVEYRRISVNGRYIRGFCLPDFAKKATKETAPAAPKQTVAGAKSKDKTVKSAVRFTVTASVLNVRSSGKIPPAGQPSNIISTLKKGQKVVWYGYYTGAFYLVQLPDKSTGYVHKSYLK